MLIGVAMLDIGTISILFDAPLVIESSKVELNSSFHLTANNIGPLFLDLGTALFIGDFVFIWIISAVLFYEHFRRIGKSTTYWMVIFLPIAFLLFGIFPCQNPE
jgi:hypothetical protein